MYSANSSKPKFERGSSIHSIRRTMSNMSSKSVEDPEALPEFKGYKYIGDPVDVIKYNVSKYQGSERGTHYCDLDLSKDEVDTLGDGLENEAIGDDKGVDVGSSVAKQSIKLGFDLMSLNGYRGHFIDNVEEDSLAEQAGLRHGDLVLEVNGTTLLQKSHDEVVQFIKIIKDDPIQSRLRLSVISSPLGHERLDEEAEEEG